MHGVDLGVQALHLGLAGVVATEYSLMLVLVQSRQISQLLPPAVAASSIAPVARARVGHPFWLAGMTLGEGCVETWEHREASPLPLLSKGSHLASVFQETQNVLHWSFQNQAFSSLSSARSEIWLRVNHDWTLTLIFP